MQSPESTPFQYANERFADIQMLRYRLNGFENLFTIVIIVILSKEEVKRKLALETIEC